MYSSLSLKPPSKYRVLTLSMINSTCSPSYRSDASDSATDEVMLHTVKGYFSPLMENGRMSNPEGVIV